MAEASNMNDENQNQPTNIDLNENGPNTMTDAANVDVPIEIPNEPNRSAELQQPAKGASQSHEKFPRVLSKPNYNEKVCKFCPNGFRCMVGKCMVRNEQLSDREIELRRRVAALECWIPAVILIKVLAGEIDSSNIYNIIDEQASKKFVSKSHLHSILSHHDNGGVHDIETERKEAHRRLEEARKLLGEKQSAVNKRAKQIEEAERKHTSLEQKIGQLEEQLIRNGIDLTKLPSTESITSFGSDDLACITKLEEVIATEKYTKRKLEELMHKEEIYINTLKATERLIPKDKKNSEVDELRSQLKKKTAANQQLSGRICLLEDHVENLEGKLAACNNHLEQLVGTNRLQTMDDTDDQNIQNGKKDEGHRVVPGKISTAAGNENDSVFRREQGTYTTVRTDTKETHTRLESTDRSSQEPLDDNLTGSQEQAMGISPDPLRLPTSAGLGRQQEMSSGDLPLSPVINRPVFSALNYDDHSPNIPTNLNADATFHSLPSRIDERNLSSFHDINSSGMPARDRAGGLPTQPATTRFGQAHNFDEPPEAPINEQLLRGNDPEFVSLLSNIDENDWSTYSPVHQPEQPAINRPLAVQQDADGFVSLASTVHDNNSGYINDGAPVPLPRTTMNVVPTQAPPRQISVDAIEISRGELQMWLNFVRETRRYMSQCSTCVWKRKELVLLCKSICHYLQIRFSVCTEDEEVAPQSPIAAVRNRSRRQREISSIHGSIGLPAAMSSRTESPSRRIDNRQHFSPERGNTLPHNQVIDGFVDDSAPHTSRQNRSAANSLPHDRMNNTTRNTSPSNRSMQQPHPTAHTQPRYVIDSPESSTEWTYYKVAHLAQPLRIIEDPEFYNRSNDSAAHGSLPSENHSIPQSGPRERRRNRTFHATDHRESPRFDPYTSLPVDPTRPRQLRPIHRSRQTTFVGHPLPSDQVIDETQLTENSRSLNEVTDASGSSTDWTYHNVGHMVQPMRVIEDSDLYNPSNDSATHRSIPGETEYSNHNVGTRNRRLHHTIDFAHHRKPPMFDPSTSLPVDPSRSRRRQPHEESRQIRFTGIPSEEHAVSSPGANITASTQYGRLPSPNRTTGSSPRHQISDSTRHSRMSSPNRTTGSSLPYQTTDSTQYGELPSRNRIDELSFDHELSDETQFGDLPSFSRTAGSSPRHQISDSTRHSRMSSPNRTTGSSLPYQTTDSTQYGELPSRNRIDELSFDHELSDETQFGDLPSFSRTAGSSPRHQISDSTRHSRMSSPNRTTGSSLPYQTTDSTQYGELPSRNRIDELSFDHELSDETQYGELPSRNRNTELSFDHELSDETQYGELPSPIRNAELPADHVLVDDTRYGELPSPSRTAESSARYLIDESTSYGESPSFNRNANLSADHVLVDETQYEEFQSSSRTARSPARYVINESTSYGESPSFNQRTGSSGLYHISDSTSYDRTPSPNRTAGSSALYHISDSTSYEGSPSFNQTTGSSGLYHISDSTSYGEMPSPNRTYMIPAGQESNAESQYEEIPSFNQTYMIPAGQESNAESQYEEIPSFNRIVSSTPNRTTNSTRSNRTRSLNRTITLSTRHQTTDPTQHSRMQSPSRTAESSGLYQTIDSTRSHRTQSPNRTYALPAGQELGDESQYEESSSFNQTPGSSARHQYSDSTSYSRTPSPNQTITLSTSHDLSDEAQSSGIPSFNRIASSTPQRTTDSTRSDRMQSPSRTAESSGLYQTIDSTRSHRTQSPNRTYALPAGQELDDESQYEESSSFNQTPGSSARHQYSDSTSYSRTPSPNQTITLSTSQELSDESQYEEIPSFNRIASSTPQRTTDSTRSDRTQSPNRTYTLPAGQELSDESQYEEIPSFNRIASSTPQRTTDSTRSDRTQSPIRTITLSTSHELSDEAQSEESSSFNRIASSTRHQTTDPTQYSRMQSPSRTAESSGLYQTTDSTQSHRTQSPNRTYALPTDQELSNEAQSEEIPSFNRTASSTPQRTTDSTRSDRTQSPIRTITLSTSHESSDQAQSEEYPSPNQIASSTRHQTTDPTQYSRMQSPSRTTESSDLYQTTDSTQYDQTQTPNQTYMLPTRHESNNEAQYEERPAFNRTSGSPSRHQTTGSTGFSVTFENDSSLYEELPTPPRIDSSATPSNLDQDGEYSMPNQNNSYRIYTSTPKQAGRLTRGSRNAETASHASNEHIMERTITTGRRENATHRTGTESNNTSSFRQNPRQQTQSVQHDLSDSESQYDSRSKNNGKRRIWKRDEDGNDQRLTRRGHESSSASGRSTLHIQQFPLEVCCTCNITYQLPKITRSEYERFISSNHGRRPRGCLAESVSTRNKKINTKRQKVKRPQFKNVKTMTRHTIETQTNIRHRDVKSMLLPEFNCEVCDSEFHKIPSTSHSTSGKTQLNASTNVSSRPKRKKQSASPKIAKAKR